MIKHLPSEKPILIIAQSARMLSSMAVAIGLKIVVIDVYADVDTRKMALAHDKVENCSVEQVKTAVEHLASFGFEYIIYGSGLEAYPETLAFLATHAQVLGNSYQVFKHVHDKKAFFGYLSEQAIPHPPTLFTPPKTGSNWLFKPMLGQGGIGIDYFQPGDSSNAENGYWQQYLPGQAMSLSFIAAKRQCQVLGLNQQWTLNLAGQPFLFAGIHNQAVLPMPVRQNLQNWLEQLVSHYDLSGLGSLDFIYSDNQCYVLEINPRPPASAQLYGDWALARHIQACLGSLSTNILPAIPYAVYQIIYAEQIQVIPSTINWPFWAQDFPEAGLIINPGQPICSIISNGNTIAEALSQLGQRQAIIEHILSTGF